MANTESLFSDLNRALAALKKARRTKRELIKHNQALQHQSLMLKNKILSLEKEIAEVKLQYYVNTTHNQPYPGGMITGGVALLTKTDLSV